MAQLVITDKNARKFFTTADPAFKQSLIDTFGEKFFEQKITDRIKTFEDACDEVGEDPNDPKFHEGPADEIAYRKIKVIVKALNPKDWKPDYANQNQRKWYPWFDYVPGSGFRFSVSYYVSTRASLAGGSRLCFASEELSNYAGRQFTAEFNQILN